MIRDHLRGIGLMVVVVLVVWAFYGRDEPPGGEDGARAVAALELYYLDEDIYSPVRCSMAGGGNDGGRVWILCRGVPINGATGGLYTIDAGDGGSVRAWAVNGRAIQHIGGTGAARVLHDTSGDPIPVSAWAGDPLNIPAALALF